MNAKKSNCLADGVLVVRPGHMDTLALSFMSIVYFLGRGKGGDEHAEVVRLCQILS